MNRSLKLIGEICEIKKRLTFHLARHTFATNYHPAERGAYRDHKQTMPPVKLLAIRGRLCRCRTKRFLNLYREVIMSKTKNKIYFEK